MQVDSYSAFFDNGGFSKTALHEKLLALNVDAVYVSGLALDFCVFYSAMDANHLGFDTFVIQDASRGITPEGVQDALAQMQESGIHIIQSSSLTNDSTKVASHHTIIGIIILSLLYYSYYL